MSWKTNSRGMVVVGLVVLVLAGCGKAGEAVGAGSNLPWERSLTPALARAGNENKLVMVDFYTDWCRWCTEMDRTTYADDRVQSALTRVVLVRLNAEKDGEADADRLRVSGYPTIIFLDPQGREVGRISGYLPAGEFLEEFEDVVRKS